MPTLLDRCVRARLSIVISGGTSSGKTSLLGALAACIDASERIVTVEDAAELRIDRPHVARLEARGASLEGTGEVGIRELVRNALRMRPDRLVVGEVRGGEALDMLQAMTTGHDGSLTTVHAKSPDDALRRIELLALMAGLELPHAAVREQVASAFDVVVQVVRRRDGERRLVSIHGVERRGRAWQLVARAAVETRCAEARARVSARLLAGLAALACSASVAHGERCPLDSCSASAQRAASGRSDGSCPTRRSASGNSRSSARSARAALHAVQHECGRGLSPSAARDARERGEAGEQATVTPARRRAARLDGRPGTSSQPLPRRSTPWIETSRRSPSLRRATCTTTSNADATCSRTAAWGSSSPAISASSSMRRSASSGLFACTVVSDPSWPVVIACNMSSASPPRTSPTTRRSGRMRSALRTSSRMPTSPVPSRLAPRASRRATCGRSMRSSAASSTVTIRSLGVDARRERPEQRRLAARRAAADHDREPRAHAALEQIGVGLRERAELDQLRQRERAGREPAKRQQRPVRRERRQHDVQARAVGEAGVDHRLGVVEAATGASRQADAGVAQRSRVVEAQCGALQAARGARSRSRPAR